MKALLPKSRAFFSPICLRKLNLKKKKQLTNFLFIISIAIKLFYHFNNFKRTYVVLSYNRQPYSCLRP